MLNPCPLCDKDMESLYKRELLEKQEGFHYWCYPCNHGWYIADLMACCFKDPAKVREIILTKDKEEK